MSFLETLATGLDTLTARLKGTSHAWNDAGLSDEWFRSHFHHAADVVHSKLAPYCDPASASLLDFGCYDGITSLALVLRYGWKQVLGVDMDPGFDALPRLA